MLQAIIVDDEIHAVQGTKEGVPWNDLGIYQVHVAYNIRQAKEVLEQHRIDIMICDIEMPQGTGLELLQWVREKHIQVESIFLTCHAEFRYAQHAVQLGSLEYMLKPVRFNELEAVLRRAAEKIQKTNEQAQYNEMLQHYSKLWSIHQPLLIERFWLDLIHQTIPSQSGVIQEEISRRGIHYTIDMKFVTILVSVREWRKVLQARDEKIMEYALRNSAEHVFQIDQQPCQIVPIKEGLLLITLPNEDFSFQSGLGLEAVCTSYIESCSRYFYCDLNCYIGSLAALENVREIVENLIQMDAENVNGIGRVYVSGKLQSKERILSMPDLNNWSTLLKQGSKEKLLREIQSLYAEMAQTEGLDAYSLQVFYHDFMQMVYYVLKLEGLQAHRIISSKEFQSLAAEATRSVNHLFVWARQVVETAIEHIHSTRQSTTVVERVKHYIQEHIGQNVTREEVAGHFYLNVDYLSRIFKKETGQLLSDYLLGERMRLSIELLLTTDLPVSTIAVTVGYSNFSHFAKIFKRETGISPLEYRKQHQS